MERRTLVTGQGGTRAEALRAFRQALPASAKDAPYAVGLYRVMLPGIGPGYQAEAWLIRGNAPRAPFTPRSRVSG